MWSTLWPYTVVEKHLVSVITATIPSRADILEHRCKPSVAAQLYTNIEHIIELDDPPSGDWGVRARLRALKRAKGDFIAYLDDDNAYLETHILDLMTQITITGCNFVFSDDNRHIGNGVPSFGHIDTSTILHRRDLLEIATWQPSGYAADWDLVERWLAAGAIWSYTGKVSTIYGAGDGGLLS